MNDTEKAQVFKEVLQIAASAHGEPLEEEYLDLEILGRMIEDRVHLKILFAHDFAKDLFGSATRKVWHRFGEGVEPEYIYHLKRMVVFEEPLDYLAKYLKERKEAEENE